ncbi:MAG: SPFH/Band 7/PHB domain protein [Candidatus Micrarchaeota archaeon]|nr:SPFH/Band 7/PHB domain protein [Candidatus Micrarchaeota archaeon]
MSKKQKTAESKQTQTSSNTSSDMISDTLFTSKMYNVYKPYKRVIYVDRPANEPRSADLIRESWSYHSLYPSLRTFVPLLLMPVLAVIIDVAKMHIYNHFFFISLVLLVAFLPFYRVRVNHFIKDMTISLFILMYLFFFNYQYMLESYITFLSAHFVVHGIDFHLERRQYRGFKLVVYSFFPLAFLIYLNKTVPLMITLLFSLIFLLIMRSFVVVMQYEEGLIFRFGRLIRKLNPGFNFIIPLLDVVAAADKRIHTIEVPLQKVITKDNANVLIEVAIYYRIVDVSKTILSVATYELATINITLTALRSIVGSMEFDYLNTNREEINKRIRDSLVDYGHDWGIEFINAEIGRIRPIDENLLNALMTQIKAERTKRAIIIESEGRREVSIINADGIKRSYEIVAEGIAKAKVNLANGEAESIKIISEEAMRLLRGVALTIWELDTWKKLNSSEKTNVILPMDVKGLSNSLKGIEGQE